MTTKQIIRDVIMNSDEIKTTLPKVLSVLSERPFNMKGQEAEELFACLLTTELESKFGIGNVEVIVPGNKKLSDIIIRIPSLNEGFELKFYGGSDRVQLSTLKTILNDIRDRYKNSKNGILTIEEKLWLIDKIKQESFDYNLSFFVKNINNQYEISIFDFDSLDIETFINNEFYIKRVGKENRIEIFIKLSDKISIEISSGRNALNRGVWLKGIKTTNDLEIINNSNYIKILFQTKININFNKNSFMMQRARKTLEIIKEY
jgi:hypothetical protein